MENKIFDDLFKAYKEMIKPLEERKEKIKGEIASMRSDPEEVRGLRTKLNVLGRRVEEATVDEDQKKKTILEGQLVAVRERLGEINRLQEQIPGLEAELKDIEGRMLPIAREVEKDLFGSIRQVWYEQLGKALDYVDSIAEALAMFDRQTGANLNLVRLLKIENHDLWGSKNIYVRLRKWIPAL